MTELKQVTLDLSESRIKLNELGKNPNPTDEQVTEMTEAGKKHTILEKRFQVLTLADEARNPHADDPDKNFAAEIRLADYLPAFDKSKGGKVEDRAREFSQEKGIGLHSAHGEGVTIPWEALAPRGREPEQRAVVAGPDGGTMYEDILYRIFKESPLGFLGVRMLNVTEGSVGIPVHATGATADVKGTGQATASAQDATFTVNTLEPDSRVSANYLIDIGDTIRVPDLESSLTGDLTMAIGDKMTDLVINGSGAELVSGEHQPTGFLATYATADEADVDTFASFVKKIGAQIDGLYAYSPSDLRALIHPSAMNKMIETLAKQYAADPGSSQSVYMHLMELLGSGMVRASGFLPIAANVGPGLIRLGTRMDCSTMAIFGGGMDLIRDIYTEVKKGQINLTALVYMDFVVTRSAGYKEISLKLA